MKRLLSVLLFPAMMLVSCTVPPDEIAAGLETYREVYDGSEIPEYTPPVQTEINGILSSEYIINDGKYYFDIEYYGLMEHDYGTSVGNQHMMAYMDLETGNWNTVCPDPLCAHNSEVICRYVNLMDWIFTDQPGIAYCIRYAVDGDEIYRADLNRDIIEMVYKSTADSCYLTGYDHGKLYFRERYSETSGKQTKERVVMSALDSESGTAGKLGTLPDDWPYRIRYPEYVYNGYFYFNTGEELVRTSPDFSRIESVVDAEFGVSQWYLDQETGEVFYSSVDLRGEIGSVYRYRDGNHEKLRLPHENIFSFAVTKDRIYYTTYDPVYYGISTAAAVMSTDDPSYFSVLDRSGGKVYAVDRDNLSGEAELIYETEDVSAGSMPRFNEFVVMGDYLFYYEVELEVEVVNGTEYTRTGGSSRIRIGLKDGSFTRIRFE